MTRRRVVRAAALLLALAAIATAVVLAPSDDGPPAPVDDAVALAYARAWDATCRALDADARTTTSAVRRGLGDRPPSAATRRRLTRRLVVPYLGRTGRRLLRLVAAVPPPEWRASHRDAVLTLRRAADRTAAVRARARAGDPSALRTFDVGLATTTPAPDALRRRTPACTGPAGA